MTQAQAKLYSLQPCMKELERFYRFLNGKFKLGLPENVVITIQSKGRKKAMAWFKANAWQNGEEPEIHEINIAAEHLTDHPYESLTHEIAHLCEFKKTKGKSVCGSSNYHTTVFRTFAESFGLKVEKTKYGWSQTSEGEQFEKTLLEFKPESKLFEILRQQPQESKQATRMHKWQCGCTIVRCAKDLDAVCAACGDKFEEGD